MAFDAGYLAAVAGEIRKEALGGRIEKITQPERDTLIFQMRSFSGGRRLLINAGSANPRIGFTENTFENPQNPPLFCVLLRKHLSGAKLSGVQQEGFERVLTLTFETRDEMGYPCERRLVAEMMGKYSNLVFTDGQGKILSVLRPVDFTTSSLRQLLPGMRYELPPPQEKTNPLTVTRAEFSVLLSAAGEKNAAKWITASFLGVSAPVAREIVFRATGDGDCTAAGADPQKLADTFLGIFDRIKKESFSPCMVTDETGKPALYAFLELTEFPDLRHFDSPSALLDVWFGERDKAARVHQRAADILRLLANAENRISHKLSLQRSELAESEMGEHYQRLGNLIVQNCYALKKGDARAELTDYENPLPDGDFARVTVELDPRLTPAANAQRYFKKYAKSKSAKVELTRQIALGERELSYLSSVKTALSTAETPADLLEIREELAKSGYGSRVKNQPGLPKKKAPGYAEYRTEGGYRVLCGKNNLQNEEITHRIAGKNDYWFHAKNRPGSHVVLLLEGKGEPEAKDFTRAAEIAALFSDAAGAPLTEVDYTLVRNLKKTPGDHPGFVVYHQNWSAVVSPDPAVIGALRVK